MSYLSEIMARVLIGILIITPALALGAVHPAVLGLYMVPTAALFILLTNKRLGRPRLDLPSVVLIGMTLATILQLVPLPSGLAQFLAPEIYEVRFRALGPLGGQVPYWMPLTLDVTLTTLELGKLLFYLAAYWSVQCWTRRFGSGYIIRLVIAGSVTAAAVFLAHKIMLLDLAYGFYRPIHTSLGRESSSAPLLNPNHLAGLLGVGAAVAIGKALAARERSKRILFFGIAALIGGSLLLTLSRGGIAAFIGGQFLFVLLRVLHRISKGSSDEASVQHLAWLPIGLAVSIGLGLFAAQDTIIGEFVNGDTKKLELAFETFPLVGKFWTTGVGRGAFWVGFPLVSEIASNATFTHAENLPVQLLADYGVIVGGAVLVGLMLALGRILVRPPERVEHAAALVALTGFAMHNLLDFNSEIPGVAVVAVALLAMLYGGRSPRRKKRGRRIPRLVPMFAAVGSLTMAVVLGLYVQNYSVDAEERKYRRALAVQDSTSFTKEQLTAAISRHPANWYIPFLVGVRVFHHGQGENPLPWLARSLELNPTASAAHYYVGRTFLGAGKLGQAMLEMRLAVRQNRSLARAASKKLVAFVPEFNVLAEMAVTDKDKILLWPALAGALAAKGHEVEAEIADLAILKVSPVEPRSLARHAKRLMMRNENDKAVGLAKRLAALPRYGPSGTLLHAKCIARQGRTEEAIALLVEELDRSPGHYGLLFELAWSRQRLGDHDGALKVVAKIKANATNAKSRSTAVVLESDLLLAEGRVQEALARLREAHIYDPRNVGILWKTVKISESNGDWRRAVEALKKLKNLDPGKAEIDEHIRRILNRGEKRKMSLH
jgi:tetratricopeptide (TPR) repeat protein